MDPVWWSSKKDPARQFQSILKGVDHLVRLGTLAKEGKTGSEEEQY